MNPNRCPATVALFAIALFLDSRPVAQHGTAAIMIWKPQAVVVGTDSKVSHLSLAPASSSCKIKHYGRFWFVPSGFYTYGSTGYDIWKVAGSAVTEARSVSEAADAIADKVSGPLGIAVRRAQLDSPIQFRDTFANNLLAFVVIGVDGGQVTVAGRDFTPQELLKMQYPPTPEFAPDSIGYTNFGERSVVERMYPLNSPGLAAFLRQESASNVIRKFINIEMDNTPQKVGPPISILEVTASGHRWIERGECPEEPNETAPN